MGFSILIVRRRGLILCKGSGEELWSSPVPNCEGPVAPSSGLGRVTKTVATRHHAERVAQPYFEGRFFYVCTAVFGTFIITRKASVNRANSGPSGGFFMWLFYLLLRSH
jgi:hypothetical protein